MWVLEARKDAEVVWYSIVWEEAKNASNVIDYNINEEITTDTSAVFNANNDTTTGMATVIPWVNAPKLKFSTSIYMDKEIIIPTVSAIMSWTWGVVNRPDETSSSIRNMTVIDSRWTEEITYYDSPKWTLYSWMKIPVAWTYQLDVTYPWSSSTYWWTFEWRTPNWWWSSDTIWRTYTTAWNSQDKYETFRREFGKWEIFEIFATMNRSSSTPFSVAPVVNFTITKL